MYQATNTQLALFQLLPQGRAERDEEVIEQALWEVDFAENNGYDSVWLTEHHFSGFGLLGVPSVYAAAIAQRTQRIRIGYAVAVVPLHHPLRLAEEISWVDHLSRGRVAVGCGPGFSPYEFAGFGVPLEERHGRLREGTEILRRALSEPELAFDGRYWQIPRVTLKPRPYTRPHPPFFRATSSEESLREAAREGTPLLFGLKPLSELAQRLELYRALRRALDIDDAAIDAEIAEMYVMRRISIAPTDAEAVAQMREPLRWESEIARRVHEQGEPATSVPTLADGSPAELGDAGALCGSPETVAAQLAELHDLGIRKVIGWFHFGNMPYEKVRRSMEWMPRAIAAARPAGAHPRS